MGGLCSVSTLARRNHIHLSFGYSLSLSPVLRPCPRRARPKWRGRAKRKGQRFGIRFLSIVAWTKKKAISVDI